MCCKPQLSTGGFTASLSGSCFTVIKTGILVCQSYLSLYLSYFRFIAIRLDTPAPYRLLPASNLTVGLPVRPGDKSNVSMRWSSNRQCAGQFVKKEEFMKKLLLAWVIWLAIYGIAIAAVNINTATKEELTSLKGIGEKRAQDIIDYRTKNG